MGDGFTLMLDCWLYGFMLKWLDFACKITQITDQESYHTFTVKQQLVPPFESDWSIVTLDQS